MQQYRQRQVQCHSRRGKLLSPKMSMKWIFPLVLKWRQRSRRT
jgi:hypothetical protein